MSTQHPVFFLSNTDRKDEFLIETRIWQKKDDSLYAEKRPARPETAKHLQHMLQTYKSLTAIKGLSGTLDIVEPRTSSNGYILFDYIKGASAERVLLGKVLAQDFAGAFQIIDNLFDIIDRLPSVKANPTKKSAYVNVFGNAFDKIDECTAFGIIDLNLDNIIIDSDDRWHLYDYEWVFDFPVPKQLLRTRFLWYFLARHREALQYHAQHIESVRLGDAIYVPKFLYEKYKEHFSFIDDLRTAEEGFQTYVTGKIGKNLSLMNGELKPGEAGAIVVGMDRAIQRAAEQQTKKIRAELESEKKQRQAAEERLHKITSSKPYRLARKAAHIKRKIVK